MYITEEFLKEKGACDSGIKWFKENFPEGAELTKENIAKIQKCNNNFVWWFINNFEILELLYKLYGVNYSKGVNDSSGVNNSRGVSLSKGVNNSRGVNCSRGVNDSSGVNCSRGVNDSSGVSLSKGVNDSSGVNCSRGVNDSSGVDDSDGVNCSSGVNESFGIYNCSGVSHALFLANQLPEYRIFGKIVTKERFKKIQRELFEKLGEWKPVFYIKRNNQKIKLSNQQAWAGMPKEAVEYVKFLPEYNAEMFFEITGIL